MNHADSEKKPIVLLVDDHMPTRLVGRKYLEREGFQVKELSSGIGIIEKFKEIKPDLVLLDVMMPDVDGFTVCQQLRAIKEYGNIPILMMTGLDDHESIGRAYEVGATDFITKPINWMILNHRLRYMLRANSAMSELSHSEEKMRYMAYHDNLTGLPNRQYFKENATNEIRRCKKENAMMGILFLDLDHFKRINDTLGHNIGDKFLHALAQRICHCIRNSDFIARNDFSETIEVDNLVARFGGDEFTLLLPNIKNQDDTTHIAERIIKNLEDPINIDGREIYISTSIGISIYPEHGHTVDLLLKNADIAMYYAKKSGRNDFQYYASSMNDRALDRLTLENDLRKGLKNNELLPYYQPKIDLSTNKISGVEVLVRWNHPERGLLYPDEFVSIAEETGLIILIDEMILETACRNMKYWQDKYNNPMKIAVNISGPQFCQSDFSERISNILNTTKFPAENLELEITENVIMSNTNKTMETLSKLKKMHIKLAIDDFGTGYSSLIYLKKFPIDRVKIDRGFIKDILTDADDAALTKAIIAMSHSLNLQVTAEGVESPEQVAFLKDLGCDEVQGFYYSRAVPLEDFEKTSAVFK